MVGIAISPPRAGLNSVCGIPDQRRALATSLLLCTSHGVAFWHTCRHEVLLDTYQARVGGDRIEIPMVQETRIEETWSSKPMPTCRKQALGVHLRGSSSPSRNDKSMALNLWHNNILDGKADNCLSCSISQGTLHLPLKISFL